MTLIYCRYTSSGGDRRIRVLNAALPVTNQLIDVFNYADEDAATNLLGKMGTFLIDIHST